MKYFRRIFSFAKPFFGLMIFAILLNSLFSILSAMSIAFIQRFLICYSRQKARRLKFRQIAQNVGFFQSLKEAFFNSINNFVLNSGDPKQKLINLSILIISIFVLKNIVKYFANITSKTVKRG